MSLILAHPKRTRLPQVTNQAEAVKTMAEKHDKPFLFRRFSLVHSRSAMKIGTDGVLVGAWADAGNANAILDVGTGCGIIALMMAQRFPQAQIDAIEPDNGSLEDAADNFAASPWADRLTLAGGDFTSYGFEKKYDFIVSNPPFYSEDTESPDASRASARNTKALPPQAIAARCAGLLSAEGRIAVIYPYSSKTGITGIFAQHGFLPCAVTDVRDSPSAPLKRSLMCFSRNTIEPCVTDELCIRGEDGTWSDAYRALTGDFHIV